MRMCTLHKLQWVIADTFLLYSRRLLYVLGKYKGSHLFLHRVVLGKCIFAPLYAFIQMTQTIKQKEMIYIPNQQNNDKTNLLIEVVSLFRSGF